MPKKLQTEQKLRATLLEKGSYSGSTYKNRTEYMAVFKFDDGTRYPFRSISERIYKSLNENDRGVVVFDIIGEDYTLIRFDLIRFESGETEELPPLTVPHPGNKWRVDYDDDEDEKDEDEDDEEIDEEVEKVINKAIKHNNKVFLLIEVFSYIVSAVLLTLLALDSTFGMVLSIVLAVVLVIVIVKTKVDNKRFRDAPPIKVNATLTGREPHNVLVFTFEDGTVQPVEVLDFWYIILTKGDVGVLTYKVVKGNILFDDFDFIEKGDSHGKSKD
ncbi:MAG: hypothetical protein FWF82_03960 [Oscillospiraceae bacterium]|nr:hypothetical protein [Oscillospiraceae bacterium]